MIAEILLGRHSDYAPQPAWNRDGGIDAWVAEQLGLTETDPVKRLQTALLNALGHFLEIASYSEQPNVSQEEWAFDVDVLLADYRNLLLGIQEVEIKSGKRRR
jgi:hypothetical protein